MSSKDDVTISSLSGNGREWQSAVLPWIIALATGLEYFDNAAFSFFVSHMAGGVNAAPDELIWSSSAYAVASILGILGQQWWVEHVGYRRYFTGCLLLFAAGSIAAAMSGNSIELACARGFQGYFIGPMMGASRIFLRVELEHDKQPVATRLFLFFILLSSALAPLAGGALIAAFGWKSLFICTALAGLALAILCYAAIPHIGHKHPDARTSPHIWPYVVFAFAQGALQIVMQQVRFELFGTSPGLILLTIGGLALLWWFVRHQSHHPKPLMRLHTLREKAFQIGIVLYIFYYFMNTALSYLTSRLLEGGLGYPVENAGRLIGLTSLVSLPAVLLYFRYSSRVQRKKWLIIPGFGIALFISIWLACMSADVSASWLMPALLLRGLLLMFIALPVAGVTFGAFAPDDFNHAYRLKNIVKQMTNSFATASIIMLEQHRFALHYTRFAEHVNSSLSAWSDLVAALQLNLGLNADRANTLALEELARLATQQANFLSLIDGFWLVTAVAAAGALCAIVQRKIT